ncbi:DUF4148 domain-containing protein [Pandoraea sp. ISTKB]|uniref:DUF4148 domain-containing protein n=1 Tax=Pandoraea sp. ISTKB TaxID=1586708 RepID=UPI000846428D|nr:DUF4148 domain-containing protein [Pandoraea sp. ISTKB]ODP32752.1 hypothetical protein A9762_21690 [Pandoraea sp. ISTKB]
MNTSILATTTAILIAASSVAIAAPQAEKTRAEVRAELKALHDVGYTSASDNTRYPANIQMAQAKLERQSAQSAASVTSATSTTGVATGDTASASGAMQRDYPSASHLDNIYRGQ